MIEACNLTKAFGNQVVLQDVSLQIDKGESVVIVGRSGCGKSVLLKHLIGLLTPDAGEVRVQGRNISRMSERELLGIRAKFGMLFQGAALFDSMTVEGNVGFAFRRNKEMTPADVRRRVAETLEMVDLPGIEQKRPSELSGGMRKRVGLARAIVYRPEVILYDEPTTGLDPIVADSIDQLMIRVRDRLHATTVVVTHDMRSARRVGQRILMLHDRQIYAAGTPDEFFASSDPVVHRFAEGIADPKETNF